METGGKSDPELKGPLSTAANISPEFGRAVLRALNEPSGYEFRSPGGIAEELSLPREEVLLLLEQAVELRLARRPQIPFDGGRPLFAPVNQRPSWRERWTVVRSFLTKLPQ